MSIKSVLSGVTSSARNPVGTGLTALERSGDLSCLCGACLRATHRQTGTGRHADRSHNSNVPLVADLNVGVQM